MATAAKKRINEVLSEGDSAPAFTLPINGGSEVSLAQFAGKQNVVVYFYPKDDTPGCTIEAQDFRDLKDEFTATDTVIIGISKDSVKKHDKFCEKYDLNFMLGADEDCTTCTAYGVWIEKSMYGKKYMGIQRATFLLNKAGTIAKMWPKVSVKGHAAEVLEAAKEL